MVFEPFSTEFCKCEVTHGSNKFFHTHLGHPHSTSRSCKSSSQHAWICKSSFLLLLIVFFSLMLPVALYAANEEVLSHSQRDFIHKALPPPGPASAPNAFHLAQNYGRLPLSFEPNHGQMQEPVQFLSRHRDYTIFLTPTEAVLTLSSVSSKELGVRRQASKIIPSTSSFPQSTSLSSPQVVGGDPSSSISSPRPIVQRPSGQASKDQKAAKGTSRNAIIRMKFAGANQTPTVSGTDKLPGIVNYCIDNNLDQRRTNIPTYQQVKFEKWCSCFCLGGAHAWCGATESQDRALVFPLKKKQTVKKQGLIQRTTY